MSFEVALEVALTVAVTAMPFHYGFGCYNSFEVDQMIAGENSREESPGSAGQDGR